MKDFQTAVADGIGKFGGFFDRVRRRFDTREDAASDGEKIAEYDLRTRGPGDFIEQRSGKIRQSGELSFPLVGIGDTNALYTAFEEADKTLAADPLLLSEQNAAMRRKTEYIRNKNQFV